MSNDYLTFIATIVVAILSLIGIIIQTKSKEKTEDVLKKIDDLRKESEENDEKLNERLSRVKFIFMKAWLTNELTKIKNGVYVPSEEQKRILKETKAEYNRDGGDSYVDDLYDENKDSGLL